MKIWRHEVQTVKEVTGMWSPTHIHVVVQRAENLLIKGKNGTNNSFVVIELGKESYRTSVKENSGDSVIWNEECELKIPKVGNTAAIKLTAYHRNSLGLDQFLGTVRIPLISFDKYQKIIQWYRLQGKPGKEKGKNKLRGELEVQIGFISKSQSQSLTSLQSKKKMSFEKLTGSLFSLRNSDKIDVKKIANSLGRNVLKKKKKNLENMEELEEKDSNGLYNNSSTKTYNNLDPGVISDEEDSGSHRSTESLGHSSSKISRSASPLPPKAKSFISKNPEISVSQWEDDTSKLISSLNVSRDNVSSKPKLGDLRNRFADRRLSISCVDLSHFPTPKPEKKFSSSFQLESSQGESHKKLSKFTKKLRNFHLADKKEVKKSTSFDHETPLEEEIVPKSEFRNKNKEELINMVVDLQQRVNCVSVRVKDLEDYLDGILVKVMETVPKILEKS